MLFLKTRRLVVSLALALLWPGTAFAQTPGTLPLKAASPQVQLKVAFVSISTADLDKSGLAFDRVSLAQPAANPGPTGPFLRYATGNILAQFFQTLLHTRGRVVQALLITTSSNVPATIQVNTQVPTRKAGFLRIQAGLTITPRVNTDGSTTLSVASQVADVGTMSPAAEPPSTLLRTIRNGDVIAVRGVPFSPAKPSNDQEVLIFITPVLPGMDARKADTGQPFPSLPGSPICHMSHERRFSLDVADADLRAVVAMLEQQANIKASVQDSGKTYKPVYVHLDAASVSKALETIAQSAGAQVTKNEDGVYVFSPLPGSV